MREKLLIPIVLLVLINLSSLSLGFRSKAINRQGTDTNETNAINFLKQYSDEISLLYNNNTKASWNYNTNITDENAEEMQKTSLIVSAYNAEAFEKASSYDPTEFSEDTKRQLSFVGSKSLSEQEMQNLSSIIGEMGKIYGEGAVCRLGVDGNEECLALEPGLTTVMDKSRSHYERLWAWDGWRKNVGQKIRPLYLQYVELKNKLAVLNGYTDYGEVMRESYEDPEFEDQVERLYQEMKPLYIQLHAYIRRKLFDEYGPLVVDLKGTLPQHLLGDMWGRFWANLYSIAVPYPDSPNLDVTDELKEQGYDVRRMYETGEDFFTSMGLTPLPSTFYDLSMLEKPDDDRNVVCHATAWDFSDGEDYRIKMCTVINFQDFLTIHHELGHIQYFQQYAHLPSVYRDGANTGFHEAVGELMSMSVSTPKHLNTIGLLPELPTDNGTEINFLLQTALSSVSALPFHYLNDIWRWKAFRGDFDANNQDWNEEFWKLSEEIVGVHRPTPSTPADLDCPSIFHVNQDYDMIRYFTRTILQFQFYESLCQAANHQGPLHECDIYNSTEAGSKLSATLQMGMSKPWQDALEPLTGSRTMNATLIRSYFQPLEDWLTAKNIENGDTPGWTQPPEEGTTESAPPTITESAPPTITESAPPTITESAPPTITESAPPTITESAPPTITDATTESDPPPTSTDSSAQFIKPIFAFFISSILFTVTNII